MKHTDYDSDCYDNYMPLEILGLEYIKASELAAMTHYMIHADIHAPQGKKSHWLLHQHHHEAHVHVSVKCFHNHWVFMKCSTEDELHWICNLTTPSQQYITCYIIYNVINTLDRLQILNTHYNSYTFILYDSCINYSYFDLLYRQSTVMQVKQKVTYLFEKLVFTSSISWMIL